MKLTIDRAGRIVLPKPLRDELQLSPGDALEVDKLGEEITLRPVRGSGPLRKKRGVWVFRTGEALTPPAYEPLRTYNVREEDGRVLVERLT